MAFSIEGIGTSLTPIDMKLSSTDLKSDGSGGGQSFSSMLANPISKANDAQWDAGAMNEKLVTGQLKNTHELTIAGCKAEVMLHLTTQIASKLSQATTQLFQMQI
jgi:flagellar hook-basal body complex protein FliE